MDVYCSTCNEPWDAHHLWHELIFETGLTSWEKRKWPTLPKAEKLSEKYRQALRAARWEFGQSVINVVRCPCCPEGAKPNAERAQTKAGLEEILGEDEDGLASTFEDYHL